MITSMDVKDPEDLALLLVQQFLQEKGYTSALRATEQASGLKFLESKLPKGSMLLQMVYDMMEKEAASFADDEDAEFQAEEERLLQQNASDYPVWEMASIAGLHTASITAICSRRGSGSGILFTGSGDGSVRAISYQQELLWTSTRSGAGGAISLCLHPGDRRGHERLLVGYMDGTVAVLESTDGSILAQKKVHTKYVVKAIWAPSSDALVSISWDGTVSVSEYTETGRGGACLVERNTVPFSSAVQDVIFLNGGQRIMLALRDTNLLRIRNFPSIEGGDEKVNLNILKDNHVSFSARQLDISPDSKYLLVSTDTSRIVLLRIKGWKHMSSQIVGLPLDTFHTSLARWSACGCHIMAAAAGGQIYTFHAGTGKVVMKIKAHDQNVRGLDYDVERNMLFTCSFDKTVKIWAGSNIPQT